MKLTQFCMGALGALSVACSSAPTGEFCGKPVSAASYRIVCDSVGAGGLAPLKGLKKLRSVVLKGGDFSDLTPLKDASKLQLLTVRGSKVSDLSPLSEHVRLELLDLAGTQVTDLQYIASLPRVRVLNLANTPLVDVRPLAAMPRLTELDLSGTKVTDLTPIGRIKGLLKLSPPEGASAESVAALRKALPNLKFVAPRSGRTGQEGVVGGW